MSLSMISKRKMLSATKDQSHFHHNSNRGGSAGGTKSGTSPSSGGGAHGSGGGGHSSVQVRIIPTMRSTVASVEREMVQNNIHKAEVIATKALNNFLDDPTQFKHLAATASGPKVVQALLPFWRLVTLLVQCKLLQFQGLEEAHELFGEEAGAPTGGNGSSGFSRVESNSGMARDSSNNTSFFSTGGSNPSSDQENTAQQLELFLPRLFERLEAIRENSVPPAARVLQTQVLRSLKRLNEATRYMEDAVLMHALETTAFVSDSDEGDGEGSSSSSSQNAGGGPPAPTVPPGATGTTSSGNSTPAPNDLRAHTPMPNSAGKLGEEGGTPRFKRGSGFSATNAADTSSSSGAEKSSRSSRRERRTTRVLSWTPKTTLSAIELYISICFEGHSAHFNLNDDSGQQEPVAADQVTEALASAERRCIDYLSIHAEVLNRRLRPCFPTSMDSPSVFDELLNRVEWRHERTLQLWNHQQMSFINNPVVQSTMTAANSGPDTPPHRPYSDGPEGEESNTHQEKGIVFPKLPLPSFGGSSSSGGQQENGSGILDAPSTTRAGDQGGTAGDIGGGDLFAAAKNGDLSSRSFPMRLVIHLQRILARLWNVATRRKRNMSFAAVGLISVLAFLIFGLRRVTSVVSAISSSGRSASAVGTGSAATVVRRAATQQQAAPRIQSF